MGDEVVNATQNGTALDTNVTSTLDPNCMFNDYCESSEDYITRLENAIVPLPGEWALIVTYIITFIVGFTGNVLVCFAIWRNRSMRTITNIFIVNLAIADIVVIVLVMPFAMVVDVTNTWFFGAVFCKLHIFLGTTSLSISILTLSAISIERWYAICHPLRFHSTMSRTRCIIIAIWTISISVGIPELTAASAIPYRAHYDTVLFTACYPALWQEEYVVVWQICLMCGLYFLPLFLMGFAYSNIALVLLKDGVPGAITKRRSTRKSMLPRKSSENGDQADARKSAAKMLVAVVIVFALCYLPSHLFNILRYAGQLGSLPHHDVIPLIIHWLIFLNSCINPIIYNFMSEKFRKEFKVAIQICFRCGRKSGISGRNDRYKMTFNSEKAYTKQCNANDNSSNTFVETIQLTAKPM